MVFLFWVDEIGLSRDKTVPTYPTSLGREGVFFLEWKEASRRE
jgi:hypothetical protein